MRNHCTIGLRKVDKGLRQRVYRKLKSDIYVVKEIHNPTVGQPKKQVVEKATNCIVVKKSEVSQMTKRKGMSKQMSQFYRGLSRGVIQHSLNSMKQQLNVRPLFQNKAPLRPIRASKVQERHQGDLVSAGSMLSTIDSDTNKYIMSVIDIFSRFLFLHPLQTKETREVVEHLLYIYIERSPPEIKQSDQGPEFKGVVKTVCEKLSVRTVKSCASPQTQGKDERSHNVEKKSKF